MFPTQSSQTSTEHSISVHESLDTHSFDLYVHVSWSFRSHFISNSVQWKHLEIIAFSQNKFLTWHHEAGSLWPLWRWAKYEQVLQLPKQNPERCTEVLSLGTSQSSKIPYYLLLCILEIPYILIRQKPQVFSFRREYFSFSKAPNRFTCKIQS